MNLYFFSFHYYIRVLEANFLSLHVNYPCTCIFHDLQLIRELHDDISCTALAVSHIFCKQFTSQVTH